MKETMKSIFLSAVVAVLCLVSCHKEEHSYTGRGEDTIVFSTDVQNVQTKAAVDTASKETMSSFRVHSFVHGSSVLFFKEEQTVQKQTSGILDGYFATQMKFYWPLEYHLDFFAYSGQGVSDAGISFDGTTASVSYTVPSAGDEDFVVASAQNRSISEAESVGESVHSQFLYFRHALSMVYSITLCADSGFNASDYRFTVTAVGFTDVLNTGILNFNDSSLAWTSTGGSESFSLNPPASTFIGTESPTLKASDSSRNDQLVIIPQTASLQITYSVERYSGGTWSVCKPSSTSTVSVPMEMGKAYDITLRLSGSNPAAVSMKYIPEWR